MNINYLMFLIKLGFALELASSGFWTINKWYKI